jgi:lipopolysaccharide/colanic/teichoic acid biosynthesis glycosyltransferase
MHVVKIRKTTSPMNDFSATHGGKAPTRQRLMSQALHFGLGLLGMVLLAPLFLAIGALIKLTSRGPVLHRRLMIGQERRVFTLYTFRTNRAAAVATGRTRRWTGYDGHDTAIGWFLKRTRLERLPQLLNVLKGEINLFGPPAQRPTFLSRWTHKSPRQYRPLTVKPGVIDIAPGRCKA